VAFRASVAFHRMEIDDYGNSNAAERERPSVDAYGPPERSASRRTETAMSRRQGYW